MSYKSSGVDIEAGYEAVERIKAHALSTKRPGVMQGIGAFGGLFALDTTKYKAPVLVAGTDGVGTKLKIAFMTGRHDTIGVDAVAYCVNDIICQGAEPLFFLDYLAMGKLDPKVAEEIVKGVAEGCRQAGCALIGGETAEMPGFYPDGEYDLAGFAVGAVERAELIDGARVKPGDIVVGIASTGLQSSGFSLVRRVCFDVAKLSVDDYIEDLGKNLGDELLTPTGIYASAMDALTASCDVRGIANISGGGLPENLPRAVGSDSTVVLQKGTWPVPAVFDWLASMGKIEEDEMYRTFNMGIGMAVILPEDDVDRGMEVLEAKGWKAWPIGRIEFGERGVRFE